VAIATAHADEFSLGNVFDDMLGVPTAVLTRANKSKSYDIHSGSVTDTKEWSKEDSATVQAGSYYKKKGM
jgi:hypothetical protein